MLLRQFPDLGWLKTQARTRFANQTALNGQKLPHKGWPSVILQAKTNQVVRDQILGPLSVFTNLSGTSTVTAGRKRVQVNPGTFFISNEGEHYTLEIDSHAPVETFNVHFGEHFVNQALAGMFTPASKLPEGASDPQTFGFFNRLERVDPFTAVLFEKLLRAGSELEEEEILYQLLQTLVQGQLVLSQRREQIPALRKSTREDVFKKLVDATDYLHAYQHTNPALDELARVSGLSKFHFLRLFKIAFGITPHQFLIKLRIERSVILLQTTRLPVNEIATTLGFRDGSSYSRAFFQQMGVYPGYYRKHR